MPASEPQLDIAYHCDLLPADQTRFRAAAIWMMERFGLQSLYASIAIVDDQTIHELNREHLDHDWPTDVISFAFQNDSGHVEGEIIASADTANRLAKQAQWAPEDELLLYVIHGLLHLCGLDDIDDKQRFEMRKHEQDCLADLRVVGAANHIDRWDDVSY